MSEYTVKIVSSTGVLTIHKDGAPISVYEMVEDFEALRSECEELKSEIEDNNFYASNYDFLVQIDAVKKFFAEMQSFGFFGEKVRHQYEIYINSLECKAHERVRD